jgi:aryl-alcohol dehydrogenase-like predicted oxidoreductase
VLSRGLLSGSVPAAKGDLRAGLPRFSAENLARNQKLVATLRELAASKRITPAQLAIAWVLSKHANVVPLLGPRTRGQLGDSLAAVEIVLTPNEIARVEEAMPPSSVAGLRYDDRQMRSLDSERESI